MWLHGYARPHATVPLGLAVALAATVALGAAAQAQTKADAPQAEKPPQVADTSTPSDPSADALDRYLDQSGLHSVLASELRRRLARAPADQRGALAERLGQIYVTLLHQASSPQERQRLEASSRELLERVPDSESFELRINLSKATYLDAEVLAEKHRLRIATKEESLEAERVLRKVLPQFQELGSRVLAKVQSLEKREGFIRASEERTLGEQLSNARRVRSLAMYYAGWSGYYLAVVTGDSKFATRASMDLGVILGSPTGKEASVERLNAGLLKYEHIARAALGAALCDSLRGAHVEALRWLDALDAATDLPAPVRTQLFSRRLSVLAAAGRWAELESLVRTARQPEQEGGEPKRLSVQDARLLAVAALEAGQAATSGKSKRPREATLAEDLSRAALEDLIAAGEAGHVLNLVSRYGSTPIGSEGFIVQYVRGLQAYDRARESHRESLPKKPGTQASAAADLTDEPSTDTAVQNRYQEAAGSLKLAVDAPDAARFKDAVGVAWLRLGLALYYAGDYAKSADVLVKALDSKLTNDQRREVLWLGIVALDKAIAGGLQSRLPERDHLAETYIGLFPNSENAAKLMLLQASRGTRSDAESLERLLAIQPSSSLFLPAQRQAANLLFSMYRKSPAVQKRAAALRFADLAITVLDRDLQRSRTQKNEQGTQAAEQVVSRGRQLADALLNISPPDPERASMVLDQIDAVAGERGMDLSTISEELAFRRLQVALARADSTEIVRRTEQLRRGTGPFAQAAELAVFQSASERWKRDPSSEAAGREVVRAGTRLLGFSSSTAMAAVREQTAEAAAKLGMRLNDQELMKVAVDLDNASIAAGVKTRAVLRRSGQVREAMGDQTGALEAWYTLFNALETADPLWGEARFESLRLLAKLDSKAAVQTLRDHAILYPQYAPDPWGQKLRELAESLGITPAPAPTPPPAPQPSPGGGP